MNKVVTTKRLSKALAAAGIASRRACEELIFAGRVSVNGEVVRTPQTLVALDTDFVTVNGEQVREEEKKVYYLLNKPKGYVCSTDPKLGGKRVLNLFEGEGNRLFTVGRLDKDTTGLLIVTNDGQFTNRVIHPSSGIQKEYVAKTNQEITDAHLKAIGAGYEIEGIFIKPYKVSKVRKGTVKVVVMEGKRHEVRILLEASGLDVRELKRTRLGNLRLATLPEGKWRRLTDREQELIFE